MQQNLHVRNPTIDSGILSLDFRASPRLFIQK